MGRAHRGHRVVDAFVGRRHQKHGVREWRGKERRGIEKEPPEEVHFGAATARENGHDALRFADFQRPPGAKPRLGAAVFQADFVRQRVADEHRVAAAFGIERGLEGKERQHHVGCLGDAFDAATAPEVDRGADVVRGRDAASPDAPLQHQVEDVEIHAHHQVHAIVHESALQLVQQAIEARQFEQRILEAVHGERVDGRDGLNAFGAHRLPADADEARLWSPLANGGHQPTAENVAGDFASDNAHLQAAAVRQVRLPGCEKASRTAASVVIGGGVGNSDLVGAPPTRFAMLRWRAERCCFGCTMAQRFRGRRALWSRALRPCGDGRTGCRTRSRRLRPPQAPVPA